MPSAADDLVVHLVERGVALVLGVVRHRLAELRQRERRDRRLERRVDAPAATTSRFGLPTRLAQLVLHLEERLQRVVRGEERVEHDVLGQHPGAALDHHDAVAAAGDDQVEVALVELRRTSG